MQVPAQGYDLMVEPLVPQQELALRLFNVFTMYYWEGMCRVTRHPQRPARDGQGLCGDYEPVSGS